MPRYRVRIAGKHYDAMADLESPNLLRRLPIRRPI